MRAAVRVLVAAVSVGVLFASPAGDAAPVADYRVVAVFPHDPGAFTQGLDFYRGRLYETTGRDPASLRRVRLRTGAVTKQVELNQDRHFGEGVTIKNGRVWWLTWLSEKAFVYDVDTFERLRTVRYDGEGWGLTHNLWRLIMSDGSDRIVFRHPRTFAIRRRISVTDEGRPIEGLNELEWVRGEIFANVFMEDLIARIDPATGEVKSWIDVSELKAAEGADAGVTNGIGYLRRSDRLFVTGKNWPHLYEIELLD